MPLERNVYGCRGLIFIGLCLTCLYSLGLYFIIHAAPVVHRINTYKEGKCLVDQNSTIISAYDISCLTNSTETSVKGELCYFHDDPCKDATLQKPEIPGSILAEIIAGPILILISSRCNNHFFSRENN